MKKTKITTKIKPLSNLPKMKKTKKQRRRTLPSMGRVSSNNITRILIPKHTIK
jgi:hypothetical protein